MSLQLNCFLEEKEWKKKCGLEFENWYCRPANLTDPHLQYTHISTPEKGKRYKFMLLLNINITSWKIFLFILELKSFIRSQDNLAEKTEALKLQGQESKWS